MRRGRGGRVAVEHVRDHAARELLLADEHRADAVACAAARPRPRCACARRSRSPGLSVRAVSTICRTLDRVRRRDHQHRGLRDVRLDQHGRLGGVARHGGDAAPRAAPRRARGSARRRRTGCRRSASAVGDAAADAAVAHQHHLAGRAGGARCSSAARLAGRRARSRRRASAERARIQRRSGSIAANTQRIERDRDQRAGQDEALPSGGSSPSVDAEAGEDERELADLREARRDGQRRVERIAEREHQRRPRRATCRPR